MKTRQLMAAALVASLCAVLPGTVSAGRVRVAELITLVGAEYSVAVTNGYGSVQEAVDAAMKTESWMKDSVRYVRILENRRETVEIFGGGSLELNLDGHVLSPDALDPAGNVLIIKSEGAGSPLSVSVVGHDGRLPESSGRLAGNVDVTAGAETNEFCGVTFDRLTLGDEIASSNGMIRASGICAFELWPSFVGNCNEPYELPSACAYAQIGAKFAADQGEVLVDDETQLKMDDSGMFVAEETPLPESGEDWNKPESWMSAMQQQTPISRLFMISSHDAGMAASATIGVGLTQSVTQGLPIDEQMSKAGARYFDLRPRRVGYWKLHTWYTCHGPCIGHKISTCFKAAKDFVKDHPGEVVFMRISHYEYPELEELIKEIMDDHGSSLFKRNDNPILNELSLAELRGKVVLLVEKDMLANGKYGVRLDPSKGIWGLDAQDHDDCIPGKKGGFLYIHDDYANEDDFDYMKSFVFARWAKQSEYSDQGRISPENRAFMVCWQLTVGGHHGWSWTNSNRASICYEHMEDCLSEGIVSKNYVRPMLINLDYVDKSDFSIVNAYNDPYRKSGGRLRIPWATWDNKKKHPFVRFSLFSVDGGKTNFVEVANGYREGDKCCFDLPNSCLNQNVTALFEYPAGTHDGEGRPVTFDKKDFVDSGTDVDWDIEFPTMTAEYIDHTADGTEILGFVDENDLTRVTASTTVLEGGKKYAVWDNEVVIENTLRVSGDAWLLLPDGKKVVINGGVYVPESCSLSIFGQRGGTGQLVANGKAYSSGAGILVGGKVTIHGGVINAVGKDLAAGIGGVSGWSGGTVTIYGGDVTAVGGDKAAGIGGGYREHVGNFTCYGGKVNAIGGTDGGAGIGSGVTAVNTLGTVTIYGGEVTAQGGEGAAAIGGSRGSSGTTVTIRGGTVKALSAGSSFGDGYKPTSGSPHFAAVVTISGGQVEWYSEMLGKSIRISGGIFNRRPYQEWLAASHSVLDNPAPETRAAYPYMVSPDSIPYLDWDARERTLTNAVVRQWMEVTEETREWGADGWYVVLRDVSIPDGVRVQGGAHLVLLDGATLTIPAAGDGVPGIDLSRGDEADGLLAIYGQTGGTGRLTASGGKNAAGIGGGDKRPGGTLTVNGGTVTAAGGESAAGIGVGGGFCTDDGVAAEIDGGSVTVNGGTVEATGGGSGGKGAGIDVALLGTVTINGGTVTAKCSTGNNFYSAGIRGRVTIFGGTVEAAGGCSSAGIDGGGFNKGDGIGVMISGGKVTATAVQAPGIRCERGGPGVVITGGEVTAIGGKLGAGIGGNGGYPAGSLLITGGEVKATGGADAAGIGGGTAGGNVIVTGGRVTATGGENGAGIGGGQDFAGGVVMITGGTVEATGGTGAVGIGGGRYSGGREVEHGTVSFDDWKTFAVRAGEDEAGAAPVLQADYADDHAAKYAKIQPGVLLKIPAAVAGYGYVVSNETAEARLVPASLADGTNTYAFAVGDAYGVYYALANDYAWAKGKGPAANPLKGTIGADTEIPEVTPAPLFAVTVPAADHATVAVTNDAVLAGATNGVYKFCRGTSVSVSYTADDGWSVAENASTNIAELTASVAVTAPTVTANVYTVTFASKFDTAPEAVTYTVESNFPYALPTMTATVDRVFRGWTNDVYTVATKELATLPDPLGDIALGAVWSPLITNRVTVAVGNGIKAVGAKDPPTLATNYTVMVEGPDLHPEDIGGYCVRTKGEAPGTYAVTFVCTRMPQDVYIEFTINPGTFMITPPVMFEANGTVTAPKAAQGSEFLKPNANATWKAKPDQNSVFVKWVAAEGASEAVKNLLDDAGEKVFKPSLTLKIPADAQVKPTDIVATWKRMDEDLKPGQVSVMLRCDPAMGTVKGAGVYALGKDGTKKVSINATPAKDCVFAGWYVDSGYATPASFWTGSGKSAKPKDFREPSQSITVTDNVYLFARFVAKTTKADPITHLRFFGAGYCGADASEFAEDETWYQGVQLPTNGCEIAFGSLSLPTVTVSGLPSGVKFDKTTLKFTGVPTAASTEKKPFFAVKISVKNKAGATDVLVKNVYVEPLPAWAVGTFDGYHMENGVTNGTFTATVGKTGKVSGKTKGGLADTTFSAKNFSEVFTLDGSNLVYVLDTTVKYKAGKTTVTTNNTLYLMEDEGTHLGVIGGGDEDGCGSVGVQRAWDRKADATIGFSAFPAFDTKALTDPLVIEEGEGAGLTLKFGAKGKVTVGGTVNGVKASGSTYVLPVAWTDEGRTNLVSQTCVYFAPKKNTLPDGFCAVYDVLLTKDPETGSIVKADGLPR